MDLKWLDSLDILTEMNVRISLKSRRAKLVASNQRRLEAPAAAEAASLVRRCDGLDWGVFLAESHGVFFHRTPETAQVLPLAASFNKTWLIC